MPGWRGLRGSTLFAFVADLVLPLLREGAEVTLAWLRDVGVGAARTAHRWSRVWPVGRAGRGEASGSEAGRPADRWLAPGRPTRSPRGAAWWTRGRRALARLTYWGAYIRSPQGAHALTLQRYCRHHLAVRDSALVITGAESPTWDRVVELGGRPDPQPLSGEPADLLALGNRLCIVGEPRSGASRLLEQLFWHACEVAVVDPRGKRLPVLLDLARIEVPDTLEEPALGGWLYRRTRAEADESGVYRLHPCFDAQARGTGVLVLLDGLGSTRQDLRVGRAVARMARGLARMSCENALIVAASGSSDVDRASLGSFRWLAVVEPSPRPRHSPSAAAHADVQGVSRPRAAWPPDPDAPLS